MLYNDLVLLNNKLSNLAHKIKKKLSKIANDYYCDVFTTSDCIIYDFTNNITLGYYIDYYTNTNTDTKHFIAYNPFTKQKLLIKPEYLDRITNNFTNIADLSYAIGNLLVGNKVENLDLQNNIYINVNIIKGILLEFLSKFNQIVHNFTDESYFENIYTLYQTLQNNLPKDKIYFYFINDKDFDLLTENSKLLPFSAIVIEIVQYLDNEISGIVNYVSKTINKLNFDYLKPLSVWYTIGEIEDVYSDIYLEYNINIAFDNEIIMDLIGIFALDESVIGYT